MAEVSAEESTLAAGSWLPPPSACQLCWPGWVMKDVLGSGCAHIPALNCQFPLLGMAGWPFQLGERSKFQLQGKLPKTEKTVLKKKHEYFNNLVYWQGHSRAGKSGNRAPSEATSAISGCRRGEANN